MKIFFFIKCKKEKENGKCVRNKYKKYRGACVVLTQASDFQWSHWMHNEKQQKDEQEKGKKKFILFYLSELTQVE